MIKKFAVHTNKVVAIHNNTLQHISLYINYIIYDTQTLSHSIALLLSGTVNPEGITKVWVNQYI